MSFGSSYTVAIPQVLPIIGPIIVAPYWTDIDLSNGEGLVNYTVLLQSNGSNYIDIMYVYIYHVHVQCETKTISPKSKMIKHIIYH